MSSGTCSIHSWNDGAEDDEAVPGMGVKVNQELVEDPSLYGRQSPAGRALRHIMDLGDETYVP